MSVILALDVGDKRVGTALTDPNGRAARVHQTFNRARGQAEREILKLLAAEKVSKLVVGLPLSGSSQKTAQALKVENFCKRLTRRSKIEVIYVDEYLSSFEAEARLGRRPHKKLIDSQSALIILERYLAGEGMIVRENYSEGDKLK